MAARSISDYYNTFTENDFVSQGGGVYKLTVSADYHGLGSSYRVNYRRRNICGLYCDSLSKQKPNVRG